MKKYFKILAILAVGAFTIGCESDLDEINTNPNDPSQVSPELLLTYAQRNSFQIESKDPNYALRMLVYTGIENQYQYYKWANGSFGKYNVLMNVTKMMEEAERVDNKNYLAIGKFLRAYHFYSLTMRFGEIPYSEALKGETEGFFQPKYDTQADVFVGILNELKEANDLINSQDPIKGDIVYGGDATKWKKLINTFRLKVLMTLSNKETVGNINVAQDFATIYNTQPLMMSNQDSGLMEFFDQANNRYTFFNDSDYGSSLYMSDSFIELFQERQDPRIFSFAERTTSAATAGLAITDFDAYNGGNPTAPYSDNEILIQQGNISKVNERFYKNPTNEPSNFLSYSEQEFMLAEASLRGWISSNTKEHYENAIESSFEFYISNVPDAHLYFEGFDINTYINQPLVNLDNANSTEQKLNFVMLQKYMTMFHQNSWTAYFDYLRTGFPELPQQAGVTPPLRWLYPNSEYNNNTANLEESLQRQFGGNDNIRSITWLYQ